MFKPSLEWTVASTGQTVSQGAFSQCWQSIGWYTNSGLSASPE
jgi:hypothetical protein